MDFTTLRHIDLPEPGPFHASDPSLDHLYDPWRIFGSAAEQNLGISPQLLNHNSLGTFDHFSHTEQQPLPKGRCDSFREGSIPVEQLVEEVLWPQQEPDGSQREQSSPFLSHNTSQENLKNIQAIRDSSYIPTEASSSIPQSVVNSSPAKRRRGRPRLNRSPNDAQGSDVLSDPNSNFRASQLERNRIAAEKCRRRRKEGNTKLLAEVSVLSSRNEALKAEAATYREQLLSLKNEVLRHAGCGSSIIDGYIAKSAGSQLIVEVAFKPTPTRKDSAQTSGSTHIEDSPEYIVPEGECKAPSKTLEAVSHSSTDENDFFGLLNDCADAGEL